MNESLNFYQPAQMVTEITNTTKCLRMVDGPLPLEIPLDGKALLFPAGIHGSVALMQATRVFWREMDLLAPGWKVVQP